MPSSKLTPEAILNTRFGYSEFKPLQRKVINSVLQKQDTLAVMPTGGGKSLCYQIPALIFEGLTVVISPLIALMKDQVAQMDALGIPAIFLNSSLSEKEYSANMALVRADKVKLLYVAPETLLTNRVSTLLKNIRVDCLTIDEAHCISEWGHDFRPEYRQIAQVRQRFPDAVCLALTATATERVRRDIQDTLHFSKGCEFVSSFDRENLRITVLPKQNPNEQTLQFVRRFPNQSGIIYCLSRQQVETLAKFLIENGYSARPYHGGLESQDRKDYQEAFIRDDVQIMVATIAFGMGINKPNVRFVLHYDLPKSLESYYQEIGRAGRDGLPSECLLLYRSVDAIKLYRFLEEKTGKERKIALQQLEDIKQFALNTGCRRVPLLAHFGEVYPKNNCGMCDHCVKGDPLIISSPHRIDTPPAPAPLDVTLLAQKFLSCVYRTGGRFSATYNAHVLVGKADAEVTQNHHETLSTFGVGKEIIQRQWLHLAKQLVEQDFLTQSQDQYRRLSLTPKGMEMLKTRASFDGLLISPTTRSTQQKRTSKDELNAEFFEILRKKRKEIATAADLPSYIIFSDRTLLEIASLHPKNMAQVKRLYGIGQKKLADYGELILTWVQEYCESQDQPW